MALALAWVPEKERKELWVSMVGSVTWTTSDLAQLQRTLCSQTSSFSFAWESRWPTQARIKITSRLSPQKHSAVKKNKKNFQWRSRGRNEAPEEVWRLWRARLAKLDPLLLSTSFGPICSEDEGVPSDLSRELRQSGFRDPEFSGAVVWK